MSLILETNYIIGKLYYVICFLRWDGISSNYKPISSKFEYAK